MRLRVVTPSAQVVDAEVTELTAPGIAGEMGILPEHVTFLGGLDAGVLTYTEGGTRRSLVVEGGYSEVVDDVVTVLADGAERAEDIDAAAARTELAEIERQLEAGADEPAETDRLLKAERLARARVEAAS